MKSGIMNYLIIKYQEKDGEPDPVIVAAFSNRDEAIQWKTYKRRRTGEYYQMVRIRPEQIDFDQFNLDRFMEDFEGWKECSEVLHEKERGEGSQEKKLIPQRKEDPQPFTFADWVEREESSARRF